MYNYLISILPEYGMRGLRAEYLQRYSIFRTSIFAIVLTFLSVPVSLSILRFMCLIQRIINFARINLLAFRCKCTFCPLCTVCTCTPSVALYFHRPRKGNCGSCIWLIWNFKAYLTLLDLFTAHKRPNCI